MKWLCLLLSLVMMMMRSVSGFTRTFVSSTRQTCVNKTPTAATAARKAAGTTSTRRAGVVTRVPFLQQGLAKAAHTRLFSTTTTTTTDGPAAEAAAAPAEGELQSHLLDDGKAIRISWAPASPSSSSSSSYRITYSHTPGVINQLTVGGTSTEATLRGVASGSTYTVSVVSVDASSLDETVVGEMKVETPKAPEAPKGELTELSRLEIRVGKIVEVSRHPDADTLYVEKIDCGEADGPRTIVSGLVKYQTEAEMINREVVVLCNLKPRAMRGVTSHGMLLCASNEDHSVVVPLSPPAGTPIGELVTFEGHASAPEPPGNRAGKAFDRVCEELFTSEEKVATYKGVPFMTSMGPVTGAMKGSIS